MKRLQVLLCLIAVLATASGQPNGGCKGKLFKIFGVKYIREVLKNDLNSVESLSYDRSTNTLFFSYHSDDLIYTVLLGKFNLNTNKFETINGIKDVTATSVDAKTDNVYVQASGGIYKYNKNSNKAELYFADDYDIAPYTHMLFTKSDIVYFTADPSWTVYKIENGVASKFKELETTEVKKLVIDDYDNMYFTNDTGLYKQKIGSQETIYLYYKDSTDMPFDGLVINYVGDVYAFAGFSGIYAVSKNTDIMETIVDDTVRGLAFDGGYNIVYSDYSNLFTLKPNNDPHCV